MKQVFLPLFLIVFLCVTFANTEIKAFAFGDRALKVAYDEYLHIHVLPTVYEMTDIGRVKLDDENLGIYFIWKHWYWERDWEYWTNYWSETLSEISSKRMGTAIGTLLIEGGSALLGTGITMLVGDLFSLGASLPANVKAVFEAGKLISIALGLTSASLNTIADTLATDKEDFISVYLAMSGVDDNSLDEARELLEALEKKKNAIMLADSEIKLIDAMNKIMNLQASTAMLVLEPATLSTVPGLLEIIDDSLLDLATVKLAPRGIKEDAEGLNLFLNASIIHLGLLVDLSRNLDNLQSEIQSAEWTFNSEWMARAAMRSAAIENAYYRVMAGYIRLHLKYLQKEDSGVMNHIYDGLSTFRSFIKNVGYYLGSGEETMVTEVKPLPAPINLMPKDGEIDIQIIPSHGHDWVSLMWEMPDTEGRTVTYDVMAGTGWESLTYIARGLTEKMFFYDGLQEGKDYYWKVIAKDTMGNSSESQIWKFSTVKVSAFLKTPSGVEMVYVEGGTFTMGDTWGDGYLDNDKPTHKVTFTYDFYIGKYETTFEEYDAFCEATGRSKPYDEGWGRGSRPVINVSWWRAIAYCNWLSEKEGIPKAYDDEGNLLDKDGRITTDITKVLGYRLPTEAEWEYAARGGSKSKGYKYSGSDNVDDVAWQWENSGGKTQEVGKKAPNELDLYDMSGNVYEWCSDWYGGYSSSAQTNPYNSTAGSNRVGRSGSWGNFASDLRVARRSRSSPTGTYSNLGFRICRTVPYEGKNRPPLAPYNPIPSDEAVVWATSVTLSWDSYDPDDDAMTYDVYFGTNTNSITKISTNQSGRTLNRTSLSYGTTYYWRVVAKDSKGAMTEGPIWSFSTHDLTLYKPSTVVPQMILVEKGSFTMGDTWGDGYDDEKPTHKVTFTYDFYMGKYETTFDEYDAFCSATGRTKPGDEGWGRGSRPVINVSWNDAIAYCNWLSEKEKLPKAYDNNGNLLDKDGRVTTDITKALGYRLPTEAEWEYAARGGNKSKGYKYAGSDNVDNVAWYWQNSGDKYLTGDWDMDIVKENNCRTQEVGKKAPNELGLYDMSGNVWEWCSDWYGNYSSSAQTNPCNSTAGSNRVDRGGSWYNSATYARVARRGSRSPTRTYSNLGFRICRTVH